MIQPACPLGIYAALLPVAALVVGGAPALSQQVPVVAPGHEQLAPAPGAPTAQVGVAQVALARQAIPTGQQRRHDLYRLSRA